MQMTKELTQRLSSLESIIEKGRKTFFDVGTALASIRDEKLYKHEFNTFEAYCQARWGWSRQYSYNLISAANTVESLPAKEAEKIQNERQARAIKTTPERAIPTPKQPQEKTEENHSQICEKPGNIGDILSTTVDKMENKCEKTKDNVGFEIPPGIRGFFNRQSRAATFAATLSGIRLLVSKAHDDGDPEFSDRVPALGAKALRVVSSLNDAIIALKCGIPHAVCPACNGILPDKCLTCSGAGFVSKFFWDNCVPEEIKKMRASISS